MRTWRASPRQISPIPREAITGLSASSRLRDAVPAADVLFALDGRLLAHLLAYPSRHSGRLAIGVGMLHRFDSTLGHVAVPLCTLPIRRASLASLCHEDSTTTLLSSRHR